LNGTELPVCDDYVNLLNHNIKFMKIKVYLLFLYGYASWPARLNEGHRLSVLESSVWRVLVSGSNEIIRGRKTLHKKDLHNSLSSANCVTVGEMHSGCSSCA
jgi:hypothetical protein